MEAFPPNSRTARERSQPPKRIERVTSGAVRRRKPLGKQFRNVFFGGDARSATDYAIGHVVLPMIKDMMYDAWSAGFERLIYGEGRRRPGGMQSPYGHTNYQQFQQRMGMGAPRRDDRPPLPMRTSRPSRMRGSFDELIINSRQEAEEVLDRLYDLVSKYDSASVADLYELTGLESSHTDMKWGWTDLRGSGVGRTRQGAYILELPEPEPLG